jgi:hypothetical protein
MVEPRRRAVLNSGRPELEVRDRLEGHPMPMRTTETTVTFRRPFTLPQLEFPQPAGTYRIVTDEEEISGLSIVAFHRIGTMLHLPSLETKGGPEQLVSIDAGELASALTADGENR